MAASMAFMPPGFLIGSVEKLVWAPAPFQSPCFIFMIFPHKKLYSFNLHGLRIKADHHPEVLRYPDEQVPGQPEVVTHVDAQGGPHLELPLGGHHLGVGAADSDPGVETGAVVSLHNVTPVNLNNNMREAFISFDRSSISCNFCPGCVCCKLKLRLFSSSASSRLIKPRSEQTTAYSVQTRSFKYVSYSSRMIRPCRRRLRSSRGPGVRGSHSWASRRGDHPGPAACTPE